MTLQTCLRSPSAPTPSRHMTISSTRSNVTSLISLTRSTISSTLSSPLVTFQRTASYCSSTSPITCMGNWCHWQARSPGFAWRTFARTKESRLLIIRTYSLTHMPLMKRSRPPKHLRQLLPPPRSTATTSTIRVRASRESRTIQNNSPEKTKAEATTPTVMGMMNVGTPTTKATMKMIVAGNSLLLFTGTKEKTPGGTTRAEDAAMAGSPQTGSRRTHPSTCTRLARDFAGLGGMSHHQGRLQNTFHQGPPDGALSQT